MSDAVLETIANHLVGLTEVQSQMLAEMKIRNGLLQRMEDRVDAQEKRAIAQHEAFMEESEARLEFFKKKEGASDVALGN